MRESHLMILDSLRAGVELPKACRAARTTVAAFRAAVDADDDLSEAYESAMAESHAREAVVPVPKSEPATDKDGAIDLARVSREASSLAPGPFGYLLWLDARLAASGFPPLSPWWRAELGRFYTSGRRWGVYCVGRGGGKSTSLVRVAAAESIFGERSVPPGQRWIWPFISVGTADATRRIAEMLAILSALGIVPERVTRAGSPTIEMPDARGNSIAFVSLASTIAAVSGPSATGATIDEESKLRDKRTNANPSTEILASLLQTFRARPGIRAIRCSSAWTTLGSHAQSIAEGDTSANHIGRLGDDFAHVAVQGLLDVAAWEVAHGNAAGAARIRAHAATISGRSTAIPTWVANPTITAVASREEVEAIPAEALGGLPRDVVWLRENASVSVDPAAVGRSATTSADDLRAIIDGNARAGAKARGLERFPGLPSWDPRSTRHGLGGGGRSL